MKKLVILLLALTLCASLCACGEGQEPIVSIPNELPSGPDASEGGSGEKDPENTEHTHSYKQDVVAPDCINPGYTIHTCDCGDTFESDTVEALGHTWVEATCTAPKTCSVCDATEGDVAAHSYQNGACAGCGAADPSYKALASGNWIGLKAVASPMPMFSDGIAQYELSFSEKMWSWRFYEELAEPDEFFMEDWLASGYLLQLNGKDYLWRGMADMGEFTFTESGSTVHVNAEGWGFTITLQRISGNQLKVTAMTGDAGTFLPNLAVGDIYTCEG